MNEWLKMMRRSILLLGRERRGKGERIKRFIPPAGGEGQLEDLQCILVSIVVLSIVVGVWCCFDNRKRVNRGCQKRSERVCKHC